MLKKRKKKKKGTRHFYSFVFLLCYTLNSIGILNFLLKKKKRRFIFLINLEVQLRKQPSSSSSKMLNIKNRKERKDRINKWING
jgi:hypothetical protein